MGAINAKGAPTRAPAPAPRRQGEARPTPPQYMREVRDEMRKVAWPKWPEVRRFSIIVLVTVVLYTAFIGGLDFVFGILSDWLYKI
jgi:preprotein translocase subunit SecE